MKNIFSSLLAILILLATNVAYAQAPMKLNYQGIARNSTGQPIASQNLGLRITIHDGTATGTTVYQETMSATTNAYGLYTASIGTGTVVSGTFAGIMWGSGDKYMQVEIDPAGGTTYSDMGTTQLLSVPYALYSANAGTAKIALPYSDTLTNTGTLLALQNNGDGTAIEALTNSTVSNATAFKATVTSTSPGGFSSAVRAINNGTGGLGVGVYGSQGGSGWGVYGVTPSGLGVYGNSSGSGYGVYANSSTGTGLFANSTSGQSANISNTNNANTSTTLGVSTTGTGAAIAASISNASSAASVMTLATNGSGKGLSITTPSTAMGMKVTTGGTPSTSLGVTPAIYAESGSSIAVVGISSGQNGIYGLCTLPSYGGVAAVSTNAGGYGLWAVNSGGIAGYFQGNVSITGSIAKGSGTFKIDHPLDPENKYLYHSFVESPDMMNIYNGIITTDANGDARVTLPAYFNALNKDVRYQLTVVGTFAQAIISEEIAGNAFSIKTDKPNVKVSWQVTGIRRDAYADAHRVIPEVEKEPANKGKYLHPVELGQPASKGIDYNKWQLSTQEKK